MSQFERFLIACSYLCGMHSPQLISGSVLAGQLFETMVVSDMLKRFLHCGQRPSLYYLRTRDGLETDLVIELEGRLHLLEIKSSMTITPKHALPLKCLRDLLKEQVATASVISCAESSSMIQAGICNAAWHSVLPL